MKRLLLLAALCVNVLPAQYFYHGYYDYTEPYPAGTKQFFYNVNSWKFSNYVYYDGFSSWMGSGAFCDSYPAPGDNIDFAFSMPCPCLGSCNAVLSAENSPLDISMHEDGNDYSIVFQILQQEFAIDYDCSLYYGDPNLEYSNFIQCE